ncbi:MAG: hypothetical protein K2G63_03870 [Oscillospiraceae bacterium]|nr:hypothetical protein [Oscillospiraceae bacterium]
MMTNIINNAKRTFAIAMGTICGLTSVGILGMNSVATYAYAESDNIAIYEEMLEQVNAYRTENGLNELKLDYKLCEAAEVRAKEIKESFSYTRPDGRKSSTIFEDFNVDKQYCEENIAYNYKKSTSLIMNAWMNSESHRANILCEDCEYISIGLYEEDGLYYWTQIFCSAPNNTKKDDPYGISLLTDDYIIGDVNNDGVIDASDASQVLSIYSANAAGEYVVDEEIILRADVNNDGVIDASDASSILQYYAMEGSGMTPEFV